MAVVLGGVAHQAVQSAQEVLGELVRAVVGSAVEQAKFAALAEAFGDTVDGGVVDAEVVGNDLGLSPGDQFEDDQVTGSGGGIATALEVLGQAFLDGEAKFGQDSGHGGSLLRACRPRSFLLAEPAFSCPSGHFSTTFCCRK